MNALLEHKVITEMECGSNFAYLLNDSGAFLSTQYKVLQSQANSCFVKCMKMLYNGNIQLYYLTEQLKSFASMLPVLDPDNFMTIVLNLFSDIVDVMHNGFLSCQNIDISFEHIYVDQATYKVSLVYLPLSKKMFEDHASFENEIRTSLVKLISGFSNLSSPKTAQLSSDLSNGTLSLEKLCNQMKGGIKPSARQQPAPRNHPNPGPPTLRIVAMNAPTRIEIAVTKDPFTIGKKAELCDGVIGFNKMISRSHCKITRRGNRYYITDLQSANGTYVNKTRLQPNQPCPVQNGDLIRLANSDFQVVLG